MTPDDPLAAFAAAAARAAEEPPPRVAVAGRVAATLAAPRAVVEPELVAAGVGSLVAAGLAAVLFLSGPADLAPVALVQPFVAVLP